jgi:UDP-2-acetamido-3-amino-2,3-dideoxy-glucuronate N-acetyltransferase
MEKNIAVIGCGYWGKNLIRNFAELGALNTVCDIDTDLLKQYQSLYPGLKIETDYASVLHNSAIKGIVIATPAVQHHEMAKEALRVGKDVFVEKPLALHVEDGKEVVELAESNKRVLLVGHLLEYHPVVIMLKEMIDRGEMGKIRYIYSHRLNLGKIRTEENILWSFAPHDISVILLLLGGEMPHKLTASGGYYLHKDIADVTITNMDFEDDVKAYIFVSWLYPHKEQKLVVVGDKKMALFDDVNYRNKLLIYGHEIEWMNRKPVPHAKEAEIIEVPEEEPLRRECQDFLDCIKNRTKPRVDGTKGLKVLEVLEYCQKSLEENGKPVLLSVKKRNETGYIHETSIVEQPCQVGQGTKIWHFSHIMPQTSIGNDCVIGQNVFIGKGVTIGNNVKIENNVSVFEAVTLEDDVFCGPSCVFTNVINPRSHVSRKDEFKATLVKRGASIGANATIVCGATIGSYALIGAGSVVTTDIPDYALAYGNPARVSGWVCECGVKLQNSKGKATCFGCGKDYTIADNRCSPVA